MTSKGYSCSNCGKTLSSYQSLWRHKKKYCTALKRDRSPIRKLNMVRDRSPIRDSEMKDTQLKGRFLSPGKSL